MKKIIISKYGSPDVLVVKECSMPTPTSKEIRIKNHFSGVNFSEIMARMKLYPGSPKPPCGIGSECCGIIDAIGKNVKKFRIGDKIMGLSKFKSYASHVCINEDMAIPLPNSLTMKEGAAFPITYITAYQMLFDLGNLQSSNIILIHGAGGGVGTAAIQLAKSINATIIGTASKWKHPKLEEIGVKYCIDYNNEDIIKKINLITNHRGVDLIIDPVGAKNWKKSYKCLARMGKLIIFGDQNLVSGYKLNPINAIMEFLSMPKYKPMSLMSSNKSIMGYHLGKMDGAENKIFNSINKLKSLLKEGNISPIIDKIFSYNDTPSAHRYMQNRKNFGKILIDFSSLHY